MAAAAAVMRVRIVAAAAAVMRVRIVAAVFVFVRVAVCRMGRRVAVVPVVVMPVVMVAACMAVAVALMSVAVAGGVFVTGGRGGAGHLVTYEALRVPGTAGA